MCSIKKYIIRLKNRLVQCQCFVMCLADIWLVLSLGQYHCEAMTASYELLSNSPIITQFNDYIVSVNDSGLK
jgi:hypothetical protein